MKAIRLATAVVFAASSMGALGACGSSTSPGSDTAVISVPSSVTGSAATGGAATGGGSTGGDSGSNNQTTDSTANNMTGSGSSSGSTAMSSGG